MAVALLERRQSITMLVKRAAQLRRVAQKIRKLDFQGAARSLGMTKPKGVSRKKQFADNWLEFSFGWRPLIQDIGRVVEILQDPLPKRKVRGKGLSVQDSYSGAWWAGLRYPDRMQAQWIHAETRVFAGTTVVGVNPDLYLANSLGFVNPALVAWESVPFSFVVDWFTNVGDMLENMSATVGCTLANSWSTVVHTGTNTQTQFQWPPQGSATSFGVGKRMERSPGLPGMSFQVKPFKGFSVTRGITAISLLLQQLKS
jgi:hypothetical protein